MDIQAAKQRAEELAIFARQRKAYAEYAASQFDYELGELMEECARDVFALAAEVERLQCIEEAAQALYSRTTEQHWRDLSAALASPAGEQGK